MTPARELFERLARETWEKIPIGHQLHCRHLETTFNDDHIFDIAVAKLPGVRIYKARGVDERTKGFDWEWWIGRPGRFWRYSVQAKLHAHYADRYYQLRHRVNGKLQIDVLEAFARKQKTIPLYCFYNHVTPPTAKKAWHCPLVFDAEQLGCTLVPLDAVRPFTKPWTKRTFTNLHQDRRALPWRCIVTCPGIVDSDQHPLAPTSFAVEPYQRLPATLTTDVRDDGGVLEVDLPGELYSSELEGRPRAIAVIELPTDRSQVAIDFVE